MTRYFTVSQAERLLPEVERALRDALFHRGEALRARQELEQTSERIRMLGGMRVNPAELMAVRALLETSLAALKDAIEQVEHTGAQIKDLDIGLIDFLARFEDRDVCLCWKLGEPGSASGTVWRKAFAGANRSIRTSWTATPGESRGG